MNELAALVRATREKAGLTQGQLAEACGWSRQRITNIERGNTNIRVAVLQQIADAMGLRLRITFMKLKNS